MVELMAPAGSWPGLRAAVEAGANAVYFGIKQLNMRINADNFDIGELKKIAQFCHDNNVRAYLTLNVIIYEEELPLMKKIVAAVKAAKIDAVIAWDAAVVAECVKKKVEVHLSTQASVSNFESVKAYAALGVNRITLARELSVEQIAAIKKKIKRAKLNVELETFVHGAMCVAVSGRCFMSQFLFGRSANRGDCLQPCRREYVVKDVENEFTLKLGNNYVMSAKDLCALPFLDKLVEAGIDVFKLEGRNRQPEYVKTVVAAYRKAIDAIAEKKFNVKLADALIEDVKTVYNRGFSPGFFLGKPNSEHFANVYGSKAKIKKQFVGVVKNYFPKLDVAEIKLQSAGLNKGNRIMFQGNKTGVFEQTVASMEIGNKKVDSVEKGKSFGLKVDRKVRKNDKVFLIGFE